MNGIFNLLAILLLALSSCYNGNDRSFYNNEWSLLYRVDGSKVFNLVDLNNSSENSYDFRYKNFTNASSDLSADLNLLGNHFPNGLIHIKKEEVTITGAFNSQDGKKENFKLIIADFNLSPGDSVPYSSSEKGERYGTLKLNKILAYSEDSLFHFSVSNYASLKFGYFISKKRGIVALYEDREEEGRKSRLSLGDQCVLSQFLD